MWAINRGGKGEPLHEGWRIVTVAGGSVGYRDGAFAGEHKHKMNQVLINY